MSAVRWRYIPLLTESGSFHMAADGFLAEQMTEQPVLRFYRWDPHAISLGFHQKTASINMELCRTQKNLDVVRRPTGGRAILHAEELTYAVVIPRKSPIAGGGVHDIHNRISFAISGGLRSLGYEVKLNSRKADLRQHYSNDADADACFSTSAKYELQIDGKKVVGSAQRKFQHTVLQHGSILIGSEHQSLIQYMHYTAEQQEDIAQQFKQKTTELSRHSDDSVALAPLCRAIQEGFAETFHCTFNTEPFTDDELQSIRHRREKYRILERHVSEKDNSRT